MAILEGCCCFSSVRKGSYACAVYTLILDGVIIIVLSLFIDEEQNYYNGNETEPRSSSFLEPNTISPTTMVFNILALSCACVTFFSSVLLLYGLRKDNRIFLVPWIFTFALQTKVDLIHLFYLIAVNIQFGINPIATVIHTIDFFLFAINIYALLCVISQYQEYQAGRGMANPYDPCKSYHKTGIICLSARIPATYHESTNSPTGNHSPRIHSGILAEEFPSPMNKHRRGSNKHVQFGSFDDVKSKMASKAFVAKDETETRNCLDVVAEEPSWIMGENSSGTPLCADANVE